MGDSFSRTGAASRYCGRAGSGSASQLNSWRSLGLFRLKWNGHGQNGTENDGEAQQATRGARVTRRGSRVRGGELCDCYACMIQLEPTWNRRGQTLPNQILCFLREFPPSGGNADERLIPAACVPTTPHRPRGSMVHGPWSMVHGPWSIKGELLTSWSEGQRCSDRP